MPRAFTLIELLVVVTIIVVLLAMLTPALDKAIYQAELVKCAANQRGIGSAVQQYAFDFKRWYPLHVINAPNQSSPPFLLAAESSTDPARNLDVRPNFGSYLSLKQLVEPMSGQLDLSEKPDTYNEYIWIDYALWFGWTYRGEGKAMRKVGDRVTYKDISLNILSSDLDLVHEGALVTAAHPDKSGVLSMVEYQDDTTRGGGAVEDVSFTGLNLRLTYSWWQVGNGVHQRGPMDLNFLYVDGAVLRSSDVEWDEGNPATAGGRMEALPWLPNDPPGSQAPIRRIHLPRN